MEVAGASTHDGGHGVLGARRDEDAQVRLAVVHAKVHGRGGLGLDALAQAPRRDQQAGGVAMVPIPISCRRNRAKRW